MSTARAIEKIDGAIRILLYNCLFWIPYSPAVIEISVVSAFLVWVIKRVLLGREQSLEISVSLGRAIVIFLLIGLLSAILSPHAKIALRGLFTKTLEWFVIFYLVAETIRTPRQIWTAFFILLFTALSTAFDGLQQFYLTGIDIFYERGLTRGGVTAAFQHANSLAAYLITVLPAAVILPCLRLKPWQKLASGAGVFILGWILFLTFSRMALLSCILVLLPLLFIANRRAFVVFLVGLGLAGALIYSKALGPRFEIKNLAASTEWREGVWRETVPMIKQRPLLGHGTNTYMRTFEKYRTQDVYNPTDPTHAHNCYIQMLAEVGILGLLAFGWVVVHLGQGLYGALRPFQNNDLSLLLLGLTGGLAAFLIHSFFDTNFYSLQLSSHFWFLAGLAVSLERILKPSSIYGIKSKLKRRNNV